MKQKRDLIDGWMAKARSDLRALNAYLIYSGVEFPFTHNLSKLAALVAAADPDLAHLAGAVESLTPYAVELRYDADFWPDRETAEDARARAERAVDAIFAKLV
jgi:hypothetical protein